MKRDEPEAIDAEFVEVPRAKPKAADLRGSVKTKRKGVTLDEIAESSGPASTALVPAPASTALDRPAAPGTGRDIMELWLEGRSKQTREAYWKDVVEFGRFLNLDEPSRAAARLLSLTHAEANELVLSYRNAMLDKGLAPATVNRRLASLRSLVKLANMLGRVQWTIAIPNASSQKHRDTRGPDEDAFAVLIEKAKTARNATRNLAILHLLRDMALRRSEVAELEMKHVRLVERKLSVLGKGKRERVWLTMPSSVITHVAAWVKQRGTHEGSLFGIGDAAIYAAIRALSGGSVRPHGLRHSGITKALDATNGDVRRVKNFSRHADIKTVLVYDDARRDDFGSIAEQVASKPKGGTK